MYLSDGLQGLRAGIPQGHKRLDGIGFCAVCRSVLQGGLFCVFQLFFKRFIKPEFVLELKNQLLRRLFSNPRRPCDARSIFCKHGKTQVISRKGRENSHGTLRTDPAHIEQQPENIQFISGKKAEQLHGIFPHMQIGIQFQFIPDTDPAVQHGRRHEYLPANALIVQYDPVFQFFRYGTSYISNHEDSIAQIYEQKKYARSAGISVRKTRIVCYTPFMIIREETISPSAELQKYLSCMPPALHKKAAFYDIETTGLGWRSSHIYLIGILFSGENGWTMRQWFLDRPFAEKELLEDLANFLTQLDPAILADYNGSTFDRPYLRHKYAFYKLPVPAPLSEERAQCQTDILRCLRLMKDRLPVTSLKLQDVEKLLQTGRKDSSSGKDLIEVYYRFLQNGDANLLEHLFLHNHDDILGLLPAASLLSFSEFWRGGFCISAIEKGPQSIRFELRPDCSLPLDFALESRQSFCDEKGTDHSDQENCHLLFRNSTVLLSVPVLTGERRLFFPDPQNYYYLPDEDQAVHKSVGAFIDPSHRIQAKASTCYRRVYGRFIPVPNDLVIPDIHCFYEKNKAKTGWIREEDLFNITSDERYTCIKRILDVFFATCKVI